MTDVFDAMQGAYPDIGPTVPLPALTPGDLGLGAAPSLPPRPVTTERPGRNTTSRIVRLIAAGLAGGFGPGAGTGILRGLQLADQDRESRWRFDTQRAQQQFNAAQADYEQQQRLYDGELQKRQTTLQQNLQSLRAAIPRVKSKAEYEQYVNAYVQGLRAMGYRVNANLLRAAAPYVAPDATARAQHAFDMWLKNPANKALLEQQPDAAAASVMMFDRDGDGVAEKVTLDDLSKIAQMPFSRDDDGQVFVFPKGTDGARKADVDARYADLLTVARANGQTVDGNSAEAARNRNALRDRALSENRAHARVSGGGDGPREMTQGQRIAAIRGFQRDWNRAIQPVIDRREQTAKLDAGLMALNRGNRAAATEIILIAFEKMQDETSVVREAEYGRPGEMQSLRDRITAAVSKLRYGGSNLTDDNLHALAQEAKSMAAELDRVTERQLRDVRQSISETLDEVQIPQSRVFGSSSLGRAVMPAQDASPGLPAERMMPSYQEYLQRQQRPR